MLQVVASFTTLANRTACIRHRYRRRRFGLTCSAVVSECCAQECAQFPRPSVVQAVALGSSAAICPYSRLPWFGDSDLPGRAICVALRGLRRACASRFPRHARTSGAGASTAYPCGSVNRYRMRLRRTGPRRATQKGAINRSGTALLPHPPSGRPQPAVPGRLMRLSVNRTADSDRPDLRPFDSYGIGF